MIKIFQQLSKKEIGLMLLSILLVFLQVRLDLELPQYMGNIAKLVESEGSSISEIVSQ